MDHAHVVTAPDQPSHQRPADETSASQDDDAHDADLGTGLRVEAGRSLRAKGGGLRVTSTGAVGRDQAMWRPEMARAMTSCWICSVPSKMS